MPIIKEEQSGLVYRTQLYFDPSSRGRNKLRTLAKAFRNNEGQTIVEYAMALGIILVLALGMLRLFETNALQVLLQIARSIG
jgi:hypothetical protein